MEQFIYTILRIYAAFGIISYPIIALQLFSLVRMIMLIRKHRSLKAKKNMTKKQTALLVCYCILTAFLWLPIIILPLLAVINTKTR